MRSMLRITCAIKLMNSKLSLPICYRLLAYITDGCQGELLNDIRVSREAVVKRVEPFSSEVLEGQ